MPELTIKNSLLFIFFYFFYAVISWASVIYFMPISLRDETFRYMYNFEYNVDQVQYLCHILFIFFIHFNMSIFKEGGDTS